MFVCFFCLFRIVATILYAAQFCLLSLLHMTSFCLCLAFILMYYLFRASVVFFCLCFAFVLYIHIYICVKCLFLCILAPSG